MSNPVRLVGITRGAEFVIDLTAFDPRDHVFAYVDDVGSGVEPLRGVEVTGRIAIHDQPAFLWLDGPRDGVLLTPNATGTQEGALSFRALGVGEFCLEIYHVRHDGSVALLHKDDFCFK